MSSPYIGRFAPSPTGPLHLGSLLAALVSYIDAKAHNGLWHLRIDDIDTSRVVENADQDIIQCLLAHGLQWDGKIIYQTSQYAFYREAIGKLEINKQCYQCDCTRKRLAGAPYDGYCRNRQTQVGSPSATRFKIEQLPHFDDIWHHAEHPNAVNDAIIWRKDGLCAYQLAVVVDDERLGVNHVIRGADLYSSTYQQLALYKALNYSPPTYGHFPLILGDDLRKLSKQNHAPAVDNTRAVENLKQCLSWLNHTPPNELTSVNAIIEHAICHWNRSQIPSHHITTSLEAS